MLNIFLYSLFLFIELGVVLYSLFGIMTASTNRSYSSEFTFWTTVLIFLFAIVVIVFARIKIVNRFKLKTFNWQGLITRLVIVIVAALVIFIDDNVHDRKHVVRIYNDTDIYASPELKSASKIGTLPKFSKAKVLRIKNNKDSMAVKIEGDGIDGWIEASESTPVFDLSMRYQWVPPQEQADIDFESVKAGYKPVYANIVIEAYADGGTILYKHDGYFIEVHKEITTQNEMQGYIYGPKIIYEEKDAKGIPLEKSDLRFYSTDDLRKLLGK